ncbi:CRISPR-associated protein Cas5 [Geitlerinema sp. P-1104]
MAQRRLAAQFIGNPLTTAGNGLTGVFPTPSTAIIALCLG